MKFFLVLTTLLVFGSPFYVQGQQCGVPNLPAFSDPGNSAPRIQYRQEVIIPSYRFTCCGVVTSWGAFVEPGGGMDEMVYTARFQVWRQIGNSSEYIMVGENAYLDPIRLVDSSELRVSVSERARIAFEPNDVVGYYLDSTRESDNRGVQLDTSVSEDVYYRPQQTGNTTFSITASNVTREISGRPLLLIGVEPTNCFMEDTDTTTRPAAQSDVYLAAILVPTLLVAYVLGFLTATAIFAVRAMLLRRQQQEKEHLDFIKRLNESARHTNSEPAVYESIRDPEGKDSHRNIGAGNPLYSDQSTEGRDEGVISLTTNTAYGLGDSEDVCSTPTEVYEDP